MKIVWMLELHINYPKVGLLDPSFAETGDEIISQDENTTQKKEEDQTSFLTWIGPQRSSSPALDLPLPAPFHWWSIFFTKTSLVIIMQFFPELDDTQFHKTVPNFSQFKASLKLGTRQVLKAQELGDFTYNFIAGCYPILAQFHHRLQHPS